VASQVVSAPAQPVSGAPVVLIVVLVLVGVAAASGVTWWLLRGGDEGTAVARKRVVKRRVDKRIVKRTITPPTRPALPTTPTTPTTPTSPASGSATQPASNPTTKAAATKAAATKVAATKTAATKKARAATADLSAKLKDVLQRAEAALKKGNFARARHLGDRLSRELPPQRRGLASSVLTRAHCINSDDMNAKTAFRSVPRPLQRRVITFCKRYIDFP
jgi:hypothetical protein